VNTAKTALLFLMSTGLATAGGWDDYGKAFPRFPCPDGWSTCDVDGKTVGPGLVTDSAGNPMPANVRFSFWGFEASEYTGDLGNRGIKGDEPVEDVQDAGDSRVGGAAPPLPVEDPPEPVAWDDPEPDERSGAVVPAPSYGDDTPSYGRESTEAAPPPPTPPPSDDGGGYKPPSMAELEAAKAASSGGDSPAPEPDPDPGPTSDPVADAALPPPPPPAIEAECDDLRALETKAMLGQLGVANRKCLDGRLATSSKLTDKDKISRVLLADAKARDDKPDWERLMKRHLESIDRSDPNMCLVFAIFLHKRGVGKATQVIKWSDYALENKSKWSGASHTRNVYYLHQLKSEAASRLWKRAEKRFVKDRNEKNEAKANKYRSMAKQSSRAWLDYAKASGKDTSRPLAACVSASGNTEFCPL
jgi:hypothetical protein